MTIDCSTGSKHHSGVHSRPPGSAWVSRSNLQSQNELLAYAYSHPMRTSIPHNFAIFITRGAQQLMMLGFGLLSCELWVVSCRFEVGVAAGAGGGRGVALELEQEAEGAVEVALHAGFVAVDAVGDAGFVGEGFHGEGDFDVDAEGVVASLGLFAVLEHLFADEAVFGADDAGFAPTAGDEVIDETFFDDVAGAEGIAVLGAEGFEDLLVFAGQADDEAAESVFEVVEAGDGFTLSGAGAGAFEGVGLIGGDLAGGHVLFGALGSLVDFCDGVHENFLLFYLHCGGLCQQIRGIWAGGCVCFVDVR